MIIQKGNKSITVNTSTNDYEFVAIADNTTTFTIPTENYDFANDRLELFYLGNKLKIAENYTVSDQNEVTLGFTIATGDSIQYTVQKTFDHINTDLTEVKASLAENTKKIQVSNGRIKPEWYGALYNGNDDTIAFQNCVNDAQTYGYTIELSDVITIKNEIILNSAIKIIGIGESGNSAYRNITTILFDNSEVDANGIATKCLFRINQPVNNYRLAYMQMENIAIKHIQQTPKNQHTIILDNSCVINWRLKNIKVYDATGSIIYLIGDGTEAKPEIYYLDWDNIHAFHCGGVVGQKDGTNGWFHTGNVKNMNIESSINSVSPNSILFDFSGFQFVKFESFIIEGNSVSGINSAIKINKPSNTLKGIYFELKQTLPTYSFDISADLMLEDVYGISKTFKCKISGTTTLVKIRKAQGIFGNSCFEVNDGNYLIEDSPLSGDYSSGLISDNLFVDTTLAGRSKILNSSLGRGVMYSQDISTPLYQLNKGVPFSTGVINEYVTVSAVGGSFPNIVTYLDSTAGRVLKITPSDSYNVNLWRWCITVPNEYIGSYITIGMKVKVDAPTLKTLTILNAGNPTNFAIINGNISDTSGKNTWVYCYKIVKLTSNNVYVYFDYDTAPYSTYPSLHTIYLADFQVWLGNTLPTLTPYFNSNVKFKASAPPSVGSYIVGDICENSIPTAGGYMGWTCITAGTPGTWKGYGLIQS